MALPEFISQLDEILATAQTALAETENPDALEEVRIEFLGAKQGKLKAAQKLMGKVDKPDKPAAGKKFNEIKTKLETAFDETKTRIESLSVDSQQEAIDITEPGIRPKVGHRHPISQTIDELKDIMGRLGFSVADGPEIEDDWHNFDALNIPKSHPARDPLENFYLSVASKVQKDQLLLRSQTSTVQIRVMENTKPPVRIISLGRVYRPDTPDDTHFPMFHQIEGLLIDKKVTMVDLKSLLHLFASSYLGSDVEIRFRPSFFPFTEPSVEVDMAWKDKWIEFGGAGMVDPNVLKAVGYDPEKVTGLAFGLGVERLCMRRHNITDIRQLYKNDIRFLQQF